MTEFRLEIMTPEQSFLNVMAEAITVTTTDGEISVLAGHAPMICTLEIGEMRVCVGGEWRAAFHSNGFLETSGEHTVVFAQACEWAEDIDVDRARAAVERTRERLKRQQDIHAHHHTQVSLARALTRLKVRGRSKYNQ